MFTFGAATSDRITYVPGNGSFWAANTNEIVSCWVTPTTLTAARRIWGFGLNSKTWLAIDTTTSQVRLSVERNTTNAEWTSPAVLTVNVPTFIVVAASFGGTGVSDVRMWSATETTPITEQTLTVAVAGAGGWTGASASPTGFQIGNDFAATSSFQGDIGGVIVLNENWTQHPSYSQFGFGTSTWGTISNAQAQQTIDRFVSPAFKGDLPFIVAQYPPISLGTIVCGGLQLAASLDDVRAVSLNAGVGNASANNIQVGVITGAVASVKTPKPFISRWPTPRYLVSQVITSSDTNITAPLISDTVAVNAATFSADVNITAPLISVSTAIFTPTTQASVSVTAPLIGDSASLFTPTLATSGNVTAGLISDSVTVFTPNIILDNVVNVSLTSVSTTKFAPTESATATITASLGAVSASLGSSSVSSSTGITSGLIGDSVSFSTPAITLSTSIAAALRSVSVQLFTPRFPRPPILATSFQSLTPIDTLGCGNYEVYFKSRGGDIFICRATNLTKLKYSRVLNETSEASVTINMHGQTAECCECIGNINPWEHEISIYRDGEEVWCGPVSGGGISLSGFTATFQAKDLSAWFDHRWVEVYDSDQEFEEADASEVYRWLIAHAYYKDPWNMDWDITDTLVPIDRVYPSFSQPDRWGGTYKGVGNELRDISKYGVDFTTIRRMYLGGDMQSSTNVEMVIYDKYWSTLPDIQIVGSGMSTALGVGGGGSGYYGYTDDQIWIESDTAAQEQFGLLQTFLPAPNLDDTDTTIQPNPITQQAYGLLQLKKQPYVYVSGGSLSPDCPLNFNLLIPGKVFNVTMTQTCRAIEADYRLYQVDVNYDSGKEDVAIQLTPLGADALKTEVSLSDGDG